MMAVRHKIIDLPSKVKTSIADQIKLLSWAIGGINGYFRHALGDFWGALFVIVWWGVFQFFAHYLLYKTKNEDKGELL